MCAFILIIFTTVVLLHDTYCPPSYESAEVVDNIFNMWSLQTIPSPQNHTALEKSDKMDKQEDNVITRENVMRVMKKMYSGNLVNRNYFVYLLRKAKPLLQSLDTIYDVPIKKSPDAGTRVTVRNTS